MSDESACSIVEMLFCTSLVALVGAGDKPGSSTRKLQIVNTKVRLSLNNSTHYWLTDCVFHRLSITTRLASHYRYLPFLAILPRPQRQSTICELNFPTSVLSVKLNRRRLVVVLEEQIYVYDISNMKLLHTIETSPNPQGTQSYPA